MRPDATTPDSQRTNWRCPTCRLAARARNGALAIPNNPLVVAAVQAICAGGADAEANEGGWRRDRAGAPAFEFWSGSGGRIKIAFDGAAEAGWADVAALSALTLDCAVAVLACLASDPFRAASAAPRRQPLWLGAPALLALKGYKRFGAERAAFADALDAELERAMRLRFEIVSYPAFDPAVRKWNSAGVSRSGLTLFETAPEADAPDAYDCHRGRPLRFGGWAQHWLNAGGPMWVSPLPRAALQLDHRSNRGADALAKKIAILLALNWGAARKNRELRVEVRALLRRVGELRRPGAAPIAHAGRLADRLEEALLRLTEARVLPNRLLADEAQALRAQHRRWFEAWCESEVLFERPGFIDAKGRHDFEAGADLER